VIWFQIADCATSEPQQKTFVAGEHGEELERRRPRRWKPVEERLNCFAVRRAYWFNSHVQFSWLGERSEAVCISPDALGRQGKSGASRQLGRGCKSLPTHWLAAIETNRAATASLAAPGVSGPLAAVPAMHS
jgi:hypothetical protein